MVTVKEYINNQVKELNLKYNKIETKIIIDDNSYSVEIFFTIDGERMQCYELADQGVIDENQLDEMFERIAVFVRNSNEYTSGQVNKLNYEESI